MKLPVLEDSPVRPLPTRDLFGSLRLCIRSNKLCIGWFILLAAIAGAFVGMHALAPKHDYHDFMMKYALTILTPVSVGAIGLCGLFSCYLRRHSLASLSHHRQQQTELTGHLISVQHQDSSFRF